MLDRNVSERQRIVYSELHIAKRRGSFDGLESLIKRKQIRLSLISKFSQRPLPIINVLNMRLAVLTK